MSHTYHFPRQILWLAVIAVLLYGPSHCFADREDLLSLVRAGHRSARESIRSFSAAVTVEINFLNEPTPKSIVLTGHYWRSLDIVRIQQNVQGEGTEDYLVKNSEIQQVGRGIDPQRRQVHYAAARRPAREILSNIDVWSLMMIDFLGPNGGRYDYDRFLEFAKESPKVTREMKDGHNCIRVELIYMAGGERHATMWHDVDHNYLVWKEISSPKDHSSSFESEILEFSESLPGVFIPMKCRRQSLRGSKRASHEMVTLTNVEVNKPIPASVFQLPAIPSGTILEDRIQHSRYPIDTSWRPLGPSTPIPEKTTIVSSDRPASDYHSQSTTEPIPFSRWLILTSLLVLVIACAGLLYRQLRLRGRLQRPN